MKPRSSSATGKNLSSLIAWITGSGMCRPGSGPVLHSSYTDTPSLNQRGTRWFVASSVNTCAISCQSVVPQWKSLSARPVGLSIATR